MTHAPVPTGVEGLDEVLRGGLVRGGFTLVQGDPGSGKTTLALQFILGRVAAGERCLYVTLTETRADVETACRSHGWSLDGLVLQDLTRPELAAGGPPSSVFDPADTELSEIVDKVIAEVERANPACVVFDGLSELRLLAGDPLRYRRQLLSMKEFFAARGVTVLLLDDRSSNFTVLQPESLVGANIVLDVILPGYGRARRRMFVSKVRGAPFLEGYHDYDIVEGGVRVYPRIIKPKHATSFEPHLCRSGIGNLDTMLGGGLTAGSTTLMIGPAGAGKSTVTLKFVVEALRGGKKAALYAFDEVIPILIARAEKLCLREPDGLRQFVDAGQLHLQQIDPAELSPGAFTHEVRRAVEGGAEIVVIDSLNGYLNAMPEGRSLLTHLHELFAYLNQRGVVTIIVVAQHGMMAGATWAGGVDVSYLADTVLLFRYYEAMGSINQAVSVLKKRTGLHDRTIRSVDIGPEGVAVGQPLTSLRGIMTGVPQYEGSMSQDTDGASLGHPTAGD
jgi:circadian clock protein KaiC